MRAILLVLLFGCQFKIIFTNFTDKISGLILLNLIVFVSMVKALANALNKNFIKIKAHESLFRTLFNQRKNKPRTCPRFRTNCRGLII
jgi:hypothetical protein